MAKDTIKVETDLHAGQFWELIAAQGVLAILFGIAALFWPGATLVLLIVLFGIFVLAWGIVLLIKSLASIDKLSTWWLELIFSLLTIGLGVFLLRNTLIGIGLFILLIGFTFIIRGVIDIIEGIFSQQAAIQEARALYIVTGFVGLIAGIIVLSQPVSSGLAFVWIVGLYAVIQGSVAIAIALKVRSLIPSAK